MNAIEFVKEHGFNEAKIIVSTYPNHTHVTDDARMFINTGTYKKQVPHFADSVDGMVKISDIKQIVDAWELVESLGGMDMAKDIFDIEIHEPHYNYDAEKVTRIEQAINLVEKCNA